MGIEIRPFTMADYDEAVALWTASPGVGLSSADRPEAIAGYLERNPGLSFVARDSAVLVGAILGGHDGRRGYLNHLAVAPSHRRQGLGRRLVECCFAALTAVGIAKCHLFLLQDNDVARAFWSHLGWIARTDLVLMSRSAEA
jgi:ribosomal protein S18 acetylase RimI-like enzyme